MEKRIAKLQEELRDLKSKVWCPSCEVPYGAMLSDRDIVKLVKKARIKITPMPDLDVGKGSALGTCKVNLSLGGEALVFDPVQISHIDTSDQLSQEHFQKADIKKLGKIIVHPGKVIVATTLEWLTLPDDIVGRIEGRSSLARRGLSVQTAPLFDAGWNGRPMLELHNVGELPVILYYGNPVCAMSFTHLSSPTLSPYAKRKGVTYSKQVGVKM